MNLLMAVSLLKKITLLLALLLLALGGYLIFVSSEAPNFFLFGDLKTTALTLFIVAGILIALWIVFQIISRETAKV